MTIRSTDLHQCLQCGATLRGRADKKFCNDHCRGQYHHGRSCRQLPSIKRINKALVRNRQILAAILGDLESCKTSKQKLLSEGFHFGYGTHSFTNRKGMTYHFTYDHGYLELEDDGLLVVKERIDKARFHF